RPEEDARQCEQHHDREKQEPLTRNPPVGGDRISFRRLIAEWLIGGHRVNQKSQAKSAQSPPQTTAALTMGQRSRWRRLLSAIDESGPKSSCRAFIGAPWNCGPAS